MYLLYNRKIILIFLFLLVAAAAYFISSSWWRSPLDRTEPTQKMKELQGEEAASRTQKLINEVKNDLKRGAESGRVSIFSQEEGERMGLTVATGSSPIDIQTGEVLTREGKNAKESASPGTPNAPIPSFPLDDPKKLPESTVKLKISPDNISPDSFAVRAKQTVSLTVTAEDSLEKLEFASDKLQGVSVEVYSGETKTITFNAPAEPGEYTYFSSSSNHRLRGAEGTMIVEEGTEDPFIQ